MVNTSPKFGLAALAITGAVIIILVFRHQHMRLADDNAALRQQLAQMEAENESLSNLVFQAKTPEPPTAAPSDDLLRLRGEVALLRERTNELAQQQQGRRLISTVADESPATNQISPEDQFVLQQSHLVDAMTAVLTALKDYAAKHNGQYPDNLQELVASGALTNATFVGNLGLDEFEFNKPGATDQLSNRNFIRARTPLQRPGGGAFVLVSGGISAEGNVHTEIRNWTPQ